MAPAPVSGPADYPVCVVARECHGHAVLQRAGAAGPTRFIRNANATRSRPCVLQKPASADTSCSVPVFAWQRSWAAVPRIRLYERAVAADDGQRLVERARRPRTRPCPRAAGRPARGVVRSWRERPEPSTTWA